MNMFFMLIAMPWMGFIVSLLLFLFMHPPNIFSGEIYFMALSLVIRSFIISCRYGFISRERLRFIRNDRQSLGYLKKDFILFNIISLGPE